MNIIVVYPGRFHPFHLGHKASYDYLVTKYGADNVFIATSDVQAPVTSPFSYADKVAMMTKLGIPASHIVKVRNPYQVKEITDSLPDPKNTALIYAISEKDMQGDGARFKFGTKKNGDPSYMQPMPESLKQLQPLTKHAYVEVTPTVNFKVQGVDANSASAIRKLYTDGSDANRDNIINDLYGADYPELKDVFDQRLGLNKKIQGIIYGKEIVDGGEQEASIMREHKHRVVKILESIQKLERRVKEAHRPLVEDLIEDYIDEKNNRRQKL
jgi:hypothetical protein